jgi:hypothetical protein
MNEKWWKSKVDFERDEKQGAKLKIKGLLKKEVLRSV